MCLASATFTRLMPSERLAGWRNPFGPALDRAREHARVSHFRFHFFVSFVSLAGWLAACPPTVFAFEHAPRGHALARKLFENRAKLINCIEPLDATLSALADSAASLAADCRLPSADTKLVRRAPSARLALLRLAP